MNATIQGAVFAELEGDDSVSHIAGSVQHWLGRLGVKVPRALCGVLLVAEPGKSYAGPDAPVCRECADLAGWTS